MAIFRYGGPMAGRGDWQPGQIAGGGVGGGTAGMFSPPPPRTGGSYIAPSGGSGSAPSGAANVATPNPQAAYGLPNPGPSAPGGPSYAYASDNTGARLTQVASPTGGTPATGQPGTGAGTGPNALEDLLRNRIRRIRTLGRGERTDITDQGNERGLGRSLGRPMEEQRQRETESVSGAERDFLAGEFESQRQSRGQELQAELERARLTQQMEIERQRADQEMRLAQMRMASEGQQNELDRASQESRAYASGGGGNGTRMSDLTMRQPGYGTQPQEGFGGWNNDEADQTNAFYQQYGRSRRGLAGAFAPP